MSCGSVPTRFSPYYRHISATRPQQTVHLRHVRFSQANTQLPSASWARMVPFQAPQPASVHTDPHGPSERATARPKSPQHAVTSAFPSAIGYLLTGHEKVREGYGDTRVHKLQQESSGSTTMARATPACPLRPPHAPLAALSHCSPYPHAWLAQIVCLKRAPGRCGRPSAAASPRCRSSPGWTP